MTPGMSSQSLGRRLARRAVVFMLMARVGKLDRQCGGVCLIEHRQNLRERNVVTCAGLPSCPNSNAAVSGASEYPANAVLIAATCSSQVCKNSRSLWSWNVMVRSIARSGASICNNRPRAVDGHVFDRNPRRAS